MATETYKWFVAEAGNLRSDYGSDAILDNGDSAEVNDETLTIRHICNQLTLPKNYTNQLFEIGSASGTTYIKVSDETYSAISSYLTTAELASVVSSEPASYVSSSNVADFQPRGRGTNVFVNGDSLSTATAGPTGWQTMYCADAIRSIAGEDLPTDDLRELESDNYKLINIALGSSSWANTIAPNNAYPLREDLRFNQRVRTLPLEANAANNVFSYWLGSNDLAYDTGLSGADCWTRATTRITALRAQFPNIKVILCTTIKRTEVSALNDRINDYNVLMRANYVSAGVDALADFENDVSVCNLTTGDTTNATYYSGDNIHLTDATHDLLAPVFLTALQSVT